MQKSCRAVENSAQAQVSSLRDEIFAIILFLAQPPDIRESPRSEGPLASKYEGSSVRRVSFRTVSLNYALLETRGFATFRAVGVKSEL